MDITSSHRPHLSLNKQIFTFKNISYIKYQIYIFKGVSQMHSVLMCTLSSIWNSKTIPKGRYLNRRETSRAVKVTQTQHEILTSTCENK